MHDIFRNQFLKDYTENPLFGEIVVIRSTSSLTTIEMMQYVDKIILWASENGIVVPPPDPELYPPKYRR